MKDDLYFISVESRKGGVGKTTAALNLAAHFYQKKLPVLLIDVDITGTNIADIADSIYWQEKLNVLKNPEGNDDTLKPVNLLELFLNRFMMQEEPFNLKSYDFSRINVIGSSLYHDNGKDELLCNPSILFDEIHVYWLIEFLKSISAGFYNQRPDKTKRAYVIFDNSPGYVGLANSIHDWLTDIGPINGKFLTISSLDDQDITTSKKAILSLHKEFCSKLKAAESYQKIKKGENLNEVRFDGDEADFFLKLSTDFNHDELLSAYINEEKLGVIQKSKMILSTYQGLLVNKIPSEFFEKKKITEFFDRGSDPHVRSLIHTISPRIVSYQKIYNYQFSSCLFSSINNNYKKTNRVNWHSYENQLVNLLMSDNINQFESTNLFTNCQVIFNDMFSKVKTTNILFESLRRDEYEPEFSYLTLSKELNKYLSSIRLALKDDQVNEQDSFKKRKKIDDNLKKYIQDVTRSLLSSQESLRTWFLEKNTCLQTFRGHDNQVLSVAFSPDGTKLASGSEDQTLKLWDVKTGDYLRILKGHEGAVWSVAFSPDGTKLASGSEDQTIKLWSVNTGNCLRILKGHEGAVWSIAFSPDGTKLASGSEDQTIKLWDADRATCLHTLKGHEGAVWSVAFSPDGTKLASGSEDQTIKLWDVKTGNCIQRLRGHQGKVWSVAFSPDGTKLASGSEDQTIKLWDVKTGILLQSLKGHEKQVFSVAFSPDGTKLISGSEDQTIKLWDVKTGIFLQSLKGHEKQVFSVAFSPDGTKLASGSEDKTLKLWGTDQATCLHTLKGHEKQVFSVAFSPDGTKLVSGSEDQIIKLWGTDQATCLHTLKGHEGAVWSVAFSPDGTKLASGSEDQTIKLWSVNTGNCLRTLKGHEKQVFSVAFSPDGTKLASGSEDKTLKLWDVKTGICYQTLQGHEDIVRSVAFSPDGTKLVSGSWDQTLRLWDVKTGICIQTLKRHVDAVWSVAFSPDGTKLVSGSEDKTLKLWDVKKGICIHTLKGHDGPVRSVAFSPDGTKLVSGSWDKTLKLWDVKKGICIHTLKGHDGPVRSVAFSPDGTKLVSGSWIDTSVYESYTNHSINVIKLVIEEHPSFQHQIITSIFQNFVKAQVNFIVDQFETKEYSLFQLKKAILFSKENSHKLNRSMIGNEKEIPYIEEKERQETLTNLYESYCQVIVKGIDLISDTRFFLRILQDISETESNPNAKLVNADKWLRKVIVSKEVPHEVGFEKYKNEKATLEYMEDFQQALKPIIDIWKLK